MTQIRIVRNTRILDYGPGDRFWDRGQDDVYAAPGGERLDRASHRRRLYYRKIFHNRGLYRAVHR